MESTCAKCVLFTGLLCNFHTKNFHKQKHESDMEKNFIKGGPLGLCRDEQLCRLAFVSEIDETKCFFEITMCSGKEIKIAVLKEGVTNYLIQLDEGTHKSEMLMLPGTIIRKSEVASIVILDEPVFKKENK